MKLLGGIRYDPATVQVASPVISSARAMSAFDTTNARITFTAPASGIVRVRIAGACIHGATAMSWLLLGVLEGATVRGRAANNGASPSGNTTSSHVSVEAIFLVTGLTGGNQYTFDAAYGSESATAGSGLKWGGPNDASGNSSAGALLFEIWDPS